MKKDGKPERYIIGYVWIYAFIVIVILFFAGGMKPVLPLSFLLGTATNLLCFTLTIKSVDKIIADEKVNPRREMIKNNLLKYLLYAVVLIVAGLSEKYGGEKTMHFNMLAVAAGFFSVKLMIYFKEFVIDKIATHHATRHAMRREKKKEKGSDSE